MMNNISHFEISRIESFSKEFPKEVIKNSKIIWEYVYENYGIKLFPNICVFYEDEYIELQIIYRTDDGFIFDISIDMQNTDQFVFSFFNSLTKNQNDIGVIDSGHVDRIKYHKSLNDCLRLLNNKE